MMGSAISPTLMNTARLLFAVVVGGFGLRFIFIARLRFHA